MALAPLDPTRWTIRAARASLCAVDRVASFIVVTALLGIVCNLLAGVISRYIFQQSLSWTQEIGQWLYIYLIFTGASLAHRSGGHIAFDFLDKMLPVQLRPIRAFTVRVIVSYATLFLLLNGIKLAETIGGVSVVLLWPTWIKFSAIPIAALIGTAYLLLHDYACSKSGWPSILALGCGLLLIALTERFPFAFSVVSPSAIMFILFCFTLAIGTPIGFGMLFSSAVTAAIGGTIPGSAVVQLMVNGSSQFLLLAIPLFILASQLMNIGHLSTRLIDFAYVLVGHLRGGLAQVNVMTSFLFGGISGSSAADAALDSKLIVPQMVTHGYSPAFSCAITSASAVLPNIIPPSIAMLIFAAISDTSVIKLFTAGIGPGILLTCLLMLTVYMIARRRGYGGVADAPTVRRVGSETIRVAPVLFLAFLIFVGIRFGVFTPTEAGVVAVVYAFALGAFIYRGFGFTELYPNLVAAATEASLIGFLIGVAAPFAFIFISERVPQELLGWVLQYQTGATSVLLLIMLVGLAAGTFLDLAPIMLIVVPLVMPLIRQFGIDPVHFGVLLVICLMIGGLTPPVGILVFISASITRTPVEAVFREIWPFTLVLIFGLFLVAMFPQIALWL